MKDTSTLSPGFGRKPMTRAAKKFNAKLDKYNAKMTKLNRNRKIQEAKNAYAKAKKDAGKNTHQGNLTSSNPIKRKLAQMKDTSIKKHEVKIRRMESEAKLKDLDPKLAAEQAKADNTIRIEKARARSKTASSTALAGGLATLGRGLSDENNQDDAARRKNDLDIMKTIFQPENPEEEGQTSGNTGLSEGVE